MEKPAKNIPKWPMKGITTLHENDVPFGRGGFVNSHKGHKRYLKMVQERQLAYAKSKRPDKIKIAWKVVHDLRSLDPPARFLQKDPSTGLWNDVGDKKFREKVSQALREHQPFIKAVIQEDSVEDKGFHNDTSQFCCVGVDPETSPIAHSSLETETKRKAFRSSRNETSTVLLGTYKTINLDSEIGPNLSEFSVSQGPSFVNQTGEWNTSAATAEGLDEYPLALLARSMNTLLPRPGLKRGTSHENETPETKRGFDHGTVKRSLLGRDKNDLSSDLEMDSLMNTLKRSFPYPW